MLVLSDVRRYNYYFLNLSYYNKGLSPIRTYLCIQIFMHNQMNACPCRHLHLVIERPYITIHLQETKS